MSELKKEETFVHKQVANISHDLRAEFANALFQVQRTNYFRKLFKYFLEQRWHPPTILRSLTFNGPRPIWSTEPRKIEERTRDAFYDRDRKTVSNGIYHIHATFSTIVNWPGSIERVLRTYHPPMEPPLVNMDHREVTSGVRILGSSQVSNVKFRFNINFAAQ